MRWCLAFRRSDRPFLHGITFSFRTRRLKPAHQHNARNNDSWNLCFVNLVPLSFDGKGGLLRFMLGEDGWSENGLWFKTYGMDGSAILPTAHRDRKFPRDSQQI